MSTWHYVGEWRPRTDPDERSTTTDVADFGFTDPVAQAEIDRLRAQVDAVKELGKRLSWDRTINKTATVARLMLECVGVNQREFMVESLRAQAVTKHAETLARLEETE